MNLSKKRWMILVASCLINLCVGSLYAWSVFSAPMAEYLNNLKGLNLTPANLAIVFVIANAVGPITMISGGRINDLFGPKKVIFVGGLMFGGGMILSGFAQSVGFLIFSYSIVTGLGLGMVYGCTISNSVKFFPDKRGLVGGLTTALFGLSSVIVPPIANSLIGAAGAPTAFKILGGVFLAIVCLSSFVIEKCPADFVPEGWTPPVPKTGAAKKEEKDWKGMMQSPIFYVMILLLTCGAFSGLMCISQVSPVAQKMIGMSRLAATTAISTLALFNAFGRIFAGYISDKIGRSNTLAAACVLSMVGLGCLYISNTGDISTFYMGISIIGLSFGAFMGVFPGFTADQFGAKNNSVNYGIMFVGFAVAGYFGPTIMNSVYNANNSYQSAFLIAAGFSALGLAMTFVYSAMSKKSQSIAAKTA